MTLTPPLTLSDAMRLGSMLHPQGFIHTRTHDDTGAVIATCALGAAEAAGYPISKLMHTPATCPACGGLGHAFAVIAHLNDWHGWTREAIADWVTTWDGEPRPGVLVQVCRLGP